MVVLGGKRFLMSEVPLYHTVDHDTFIKCQLAFAQSISGPYVVQMWSRYPPELEVPLQVFGVSQRGWVPAGVSRGGVSLGLC